MTLWLPFLSGILLSLTLPQVGLWPLVWIALVPYVLFLSDNRVTAWKNILGSLLFGVPYGIATVYPLMQITGWWWTPSSMPQAVSPELLFAGGVALVSLFGALFFVPFGLAVRKWGRGSLSPLILAVLWVTMEWIRSFALSGFSWGVLGYALVDTEFLKHIAAVFNVYGLSFLVVGVNAAFALCLVLRGGLPMNFKNTSEQLLRVVREEPKRMHGVFFVVLFFVGALAFGFARERVLSCDGTPRTVAAIGSTLTTEESVGEGAYRHYRTKILAALKERPDVVVLPENTFPFFELDEKDWSLRPYALVPLHNKEELYGDLLGITRDYPETVFAVGLHTINGTKRYNSTVFYQNGEVVARYHKRKLVPFTEFVPPPFSLPLFVTLEAGEARQLFEVKGIRVTGLSCSEIGNSRVDISGAQLIVASSNDSVVVGTAISRVHETMARMRALEAGAYLLRASKGEETSIIAPNGDIIVRGEGVLVATMEQCGT